MGFEAHLFFNSIGQIYQMLLEALCHINCWGQPGDNHAAEQPPQGPTRNRGFGVPPGMKCQDYYHVQGVLNLPIIT